MTRRARVDWTTYEQAQFYAAVVDLLKGRKIELPISTAAGRTAFLQACRDAQVAIVENRRRNIASIDNITGDLRRRFIETGVLPQHPEKLKKGGEVARGRRRPARRAHQGAGRAARRRRRRGRKAVMDLLDKCERELTANVPFVAKQFGEFIENTTEAAKTEIEAYLTSAVHRAGLESLAGRAPIAMPKTPPLINDDTEGKQ